MKVRSTLPIWLGLSFMLSLPGVSHGKTVLNYVTWWGGDMAVTEKLAIDTFMERNPDIQVKMSTWPWDGYHDKLLAATIGGLSPDVFKADVYYMRDYIDSGIALNLQPYLKRDKVDTSSWYQFTLDPVKSPQDGNLYGFPSNWGGLMMFANRNFFTQNGLNVPDDGWTWEQFVQSMDKMKKDTNGDGKPDRFGVGVGYWCWWAWAYTNGVNIFSPDQRKVTFNTPEFGSTLKFMSDLLSVWKVGTGDDIANWNSGKMGLKVTWSHTLQSVNPKFPVTLLEFPYKKTRTYTIKGDCMAIAAGSRKKDAAWKFMKWYTSPEFQTLQMKHGLAPLQKKLAETEWVKWKKPGADMEFRNALPIQPGRTPKYLECNIPVWRKMETIWNPEIEKMNSGKTDPYTIGPNLNSKLQKILDDYWARMDKRKRK